MKSKKHYQRILLTFSLIFFASFSSAAEQGITVTGKAKVSVVPDIALFSFAINGRGKELGVLKADIDKKTAALVSLSKKTGIKKKNISSSEVSIRPQYNYQTKVFTGYEVSRNIKVRLDNLDKYTELVNGAIASGITTINGVKLDISNRDELERKVLATAVKDAKKKADILAKSTGVNLGKVVSIQEGGQRIVHDSFQFREMASTQSASQQGSFEPGEIKVTTSVVVNYAIK